MSEMILETPRLWLRPFRDSDAADVYAYARDPQVGPIAGWQPHKSQEESREIIRTVFSAPGVFAMELKETGKVVGSVGYVGNHPVGVRPDCPDDEVGYALAPACWGRGLMPEAVNEVIRWLFEERKLDAILCAHFDWNAQSARVQQKCGFRPFAEGSYETRYGTTEKDITNILYREDWEASHK